MRLSPLSRDELDPEQQAVLHAIESGPRGVDANGERREGIGMIGPFGVWVRTPGVGLPIQALGAAVRFNTSLPENVKEVAICTVGAFHRSKFEFSAHRALAIRAGVSEAALDQLIANTHPDFNGNEQLAYTITNQLLTEHKIIPDTYAHGLEAFGEDGMIELVATVGYYCLISLTLNAFEIPLADNMRDPFPEDA